VFEVREDDLSDEACRQLLALHLAAMHANSPPGCTYALDLSGLKAPGVTVWSVWDGGTVVGIGALKELGAGNAEIKSMRTHPDHLRRGVAVLLLDHIVAVAKQRGLARLSLETGSGPTFEPALALYRRRGFIDGEAFSEYRQNGFSQFLHLSL
jgi:putative acetyltransferase